jgi:hypothetical protein
MNSPLVTLTSSVIRGSSTTSLPDERSWKAMLSFLDETFAPPTSPHCERFSEHRLFVNRMLR